MKMGGIGTLDISVDGQLVFSYKQAGHMPDDDTVLKLIEARRTAAGID